MRLSLPLIAPAQYFFQQVTQSLLSFTFSTSCCCFVRGKKKKQIRLALQKTNPVCETIPLGQPPEVNCLISWEDEHCYKERVGTGRWKEIQRVWTVVAPCTEDIGSTTDRTVLTAVLQLAEAHNGFLPLTQGWPGSYNYS